MATPSYPLGSKFNLEGNLQELFTSMDFTPDSQNKAGNFNARYFRSELIANTPQEIFHDLGRIPVGFIPVYKSGYANVRIITITERLIEIEADDNLTLKGIVI